PARHTAPRRRRATRARRATTAPACARGYHAAMATESNIRLAVTMDDVGIERIRWEADDSPEPGLHDAGAMILALWDPERRNALRIDLWVKEMTVDDMNDFFFQTLLSMADTYAKATTDTALASEIKLFARDFAERASKKAHAQARGQAGWGAPVAAGRPRPPATEHGGSVKALPS